MGSGIQSINGSTTLVAPEYFGGPRHWPLGHSLGHWVQQLGGIMLLYSQRRAGYKIKTGRDNVVYNVFFIHSRYFATCLADLDWYLVF